MNVIEKRNRFQPGVNNSKRTVEKQRLTTGLDLVGRWMEGGTEG